MRSDIMYSKNEDEIFKILNSNIDGLNSKETKKRINDRKCGAWMPYHQDKGV